MFRPKNVSLVGRKSIGPMGGEIQENVITRVKSVGPTKAHEQICVVALSSVRLSVAVHVVLSSKKESQPDG